MRRACQNMLSAEQYQMVLESGLFSNDSVEPDHRYYSLLKKCPKFLRKYVSNNFYKYDFFNDEYEEEDENLDFLYKDELKYVFMLENSRSYRRFKRKFQIKEY